MGDIVLVLTSSAIAAVLLIAGTIEVFAYKMMSKHIINFPQRPPMQSYQIGDGLLYRGKKYIVIHITESEVVALKTLSNIINDWRSK